MKAIGKILDRIEDIFGYLGGALLGITTIIVIVQIICRYVLFYSLPWSEELCKYMFVWLVFLSFSLCVRNHMQIKIDILETSIKQKTLKGLLKLFYDVVSLGFVCIYIYCAIQLVSAGTLSVSPAMHLPMWYVYMVMPIGLALSGIEFIRQVFIDIKELSGGKREGES